MTWNDVTRPPSERVLRQFAGLLVVLGAALIVISLRPGSGEETGTLPIGIGFGIGLAAAALGTMGWVRPPAIRGVFRGAMMVAFPVGFLVSHILLGILFYGVFLATALLLRARGWDPMHRQRDPKASTYWTGKTTPRDLRRYLRQY